MLEPTTDPADALRAEVIQLNQQLDGLRTTLTDRLDALTHRGHPDSSMAPVRDDLALVTDVLAGLTQVVEALQMQLAAIPHRLDEAMAELGRKIDVIPAPDLGPVAAQLARLSATIVSRTEQSSVDEQLASLSRSFEEAMQIIAQRLEDQAQATTEVWVHLAKQPSPAEQADDLRHEVGRATAGLRASLDRISSELGATRDAVERRSEARSAATDETKLRDVLRAMDARLASMESLVASAAKSSPPRTRSARKASPRKAAKKTPTKKSAKKSAKKTSTRKRAAPSKRRARPGR